MNLEQQKKQARELLRAIRAGNEDAISRLRRHHSRWTAVDDASVRQLGRCTMPSLSWLANKGSPVAQAEVLRRAVPALSSHAPVRRRRGVDHRAGSWFVADPPIGGPQR